MNQDTQNTQRTALTEADRAAIVDALASLVQASAQSAKPAQSSPTQQPVKEIDLIALIVQLLSKVHIILLAALIVVNYKRGRTKDVADVAEQIRKTGCTVLGNVLNKVNFNTIANRMYYYKSERYASHYKGAYSAYKPLPREKR